jgi:tRNA threonylcarbamoyl adenosine modification protein YeaZ
MRILAIDTALPAVSLCVMDQGDEKLLACETHPMKRGHAEALLPLLDRVIGSLEGGLASVGKIAVTVGPGSFTGIRVGLAAARALGLACGIPVVGVSTLAAFAAPLILEGGSSRIVASVDAQYGRFYVQVFGPRGNIVTSPQIMKSADAIRLIAPAPCRLTGSGAPLLILDAWAERLEAEVAGELIAPDIRFVARLGLIAEPRTAPPRPLYLKEPDVKLPPPPVSQPL